MPQPKILTYVTPDTLVTINTKVVWCGGNLLQRTLFALIASTARPHVNKSLPMIWRPKQITVERVSFT